MTAHGSLDPIKKKSSSSFCTQFFLVFLLLNLGGAAYAMCVTNLHAEITVHYHFLFCFCFIGDRGFDRRAAGWRERFG
jgi:hypothetical protein